MKEISLFDVIGPNMIGPSSSHTAGALRIASMARRIIKEDIKSVTFELYGSFAYTYQGHGTDRALVGGILGFSSEDERIRDAFKIAEEEGLEYKFVLIKDVEPQLPNTVTIIVNTETTKWRITGSSIGGGEFIISNVNGVDMEMNGEYYTLLVKQNDRPGVVAHITNILAQYKVNIAHMKLYREERNKIAYTIIEMDEDINTDVVSEIAAMEAIEFVTYIEK